MKLKTKIYTIRVKVSIEGEINLQVYKDEELSHLVIKESYVCQRTRANDGITISNNVISRLY